MAALTTLVDLFENACSEHAGRPFLGTRRGEHWDWTAYSEFADKVSHMRAGLRALGVNAGDRVALIVNNSEEWAVIACAAHGIGAPIVPMYQSQQASEWAFILADSSAKVVFARNEEIARSVHAVRAQLPALATIVRVDDGAHGEESYANLLRDGTLPARSPRPDEIATFIYTSGTTGKPKGVLLSHANIMSNINGVRQVFTFAPEERSLSFLPWAHAFGQVAELYVLCSMGCSIAINDDLKRLLDDMQDVHPSVLFAVPRVFNKLYAAVHHRMDDSPELVRHLFDDALELSEERAHGHALPLRKRVELALADKLLFSRLRSKLGGKLKYAISASATLNPEVAAFVSAIGIPLYEGYGLTETSPIVSVNYPGMSRQGSVGKPIPGVRVEIDTRVAEDSKDGEILIHGPNVMRGYHQRPDQTRAALTADGGLRTGDLGRIDADGFLYITGRIKEQYKLSNGKYVMPAPLEEQLKLSPLIVNVLLYGADHDYNVALVVMDRKTLVERAEARGLVLDASATDNAVARQLIQQELDELSQTFPAYERPRRCLLISEDFSIENGLLTPTLKLRRPAVIERYRAALEALYTEGTTALSAQLNP